MVKYRFEQIAINSTEKKKPVEEDRFTYLGLEHLDSGSLKVTRFGSEVAPIGEKLVMHKGDVLFGKRRAYQKKVAIAPFDGIFSAHGMVLRPREDVIDKSFFPLFISSDYFLDAAIKISVGSLSPTINWRDLKTLEFELPDLATQRKLAETLWSINDTMETYKKLIAATDELVKSQFMELFGDPVTNTQGREVRPFKDFMLDIRYGTSQPPTFNELGEFKFIRATNIKAGRITENGMLRISADEAAKIEKCRLNGNEIIIVCNFVPVERRDYKIGVPNKGRYKLIFNTDAVEFGGTGVTEKSFKTSHYSMHGFDESISMTLAPLSVIYLQYALQIHKFHELLLYSQNIFQLIIVYSLQLMLFLN